MCGIFGLANSSESPLPAAELRKLTDRLFRLSESRGKEASGLTLLPSLESSSLFVVKSPITASKLIENRQFKDFFQSAFQESPDMKAGFAFGHTRLVTNGSQLDQDNNQPVIREGSVAVHNGIIVNVDELWKKHTDLKRHSEVDTEIIVALVRKYFTQTQSLAVAVQMAFAEISGMASVVLTFAELNVLVLATNNGSLYFAAGEKNLPVFFASERFMLDRFLRSQPNLHAHKIRQVYPNEGLLIDLKSFSQTFFPLATSPAATAIAQNAGMPALPTARNVRAINIGKSNGMHSVFTIRKVIAPERFEKTFAQNAKAVARLRRCTRCVLPETVPFIAFDDTGVCNFCTNYKKIELLGRDALEEAVKPFRRPGRGADCVSSMSGGRDSCYGLHYLVKELGLKPLTYTYDWGMVTDLARRNISRMCSKLGIEHILISANIPWKRENIRKNVVAWLAKPHLGMIPLFMAGDKQFVWYANRVRKQTGLKLDFFTFNLMEKTQFKEEYTGIQFWKPGKDADKLGEELGLVRGIKLCSFYGWQFLSNPRYLNRSLLDTFYGFVAYYLLPQTFVPLFRYVPWREDVVSKTLIEEYDWEVATDTQTTWRIGDGTAPFYNYIYYTLGGFTENDTLRSNQIREGHMTREQAMALVERDNQPRWDSMKWYCDTIGLDFEKVVDRIHQIPKQFA